MKISEAADKIQQLLDLGELKLDNIGPQIGKSKKWVYDMYSLRNLVPAAKEAVDDRKITLHNAFLLSRMKPDEQQSILEQAKTEVGSVFAKTVRRVKDKRTKPS